MSLMIEFARKEELKEAIRELLRDGNQRTRFEQVIKKIIDENICNLNVQTQDGEQIPNSIMSIGEGKPSYIDQDEQLPQLFVKDEETNLESFRDSNLGLKTWKPNSIQSSKRTSEELNRRSNFDKDDLESEANIEIRGTSKMIKAEEFLIQTDIKTKATLIDRHKKMRVDLTDDNIYIDKSTSFGYQIIYQGRAIDKKCLEQITETKAEKTNSGFLLCKIHDECSYSKPPEKKRLIKQNRFNRHSRSHISSNLVKYFCRVCLRTLSYSLTIASHLRRHLKPTFLKNSEGPTGDVDIKKITPKIMQPHPDLSLIDYQEKYRLGITNQNMHSYSKFDCKYQIYYKGRAIDKDQLKQIMEKKVIKLKSGLFLCPLHEDCPYSREKSSIKRRGPFNRTVLEHTGAAFITYLCRHCFHKFNCSVSIYRHLRIHYNS